MPPVPPASAPIPVDFANSFDSPGSQPVVVLDPESLGDHDIGDVVWLSDGEVKVQGTIELSGDVFTARLHMATAVGVGNAVPIPAFHDEAGNVLHAPLVWRDIKGEDPDVYRRALKMHPKELVWEAQEAMRGENGQEQG